MSPLCKKVWNTLSTRCSKPSSSSSTQPSPSEFPPPLGGAFDRLPYDIVMQIVSLLRPKDAAKLSMVCKTFNLIVDDNKLWMVFLQCYDQLWELAFFAELNLRRRLPLEDSQDLDFSFMRIYGQRMQVPGAVVVDGGSGYCKFGWSKYAGPSGRSATFLEFANIETPMKSTLKHFFVNFFRRMQVRPNAQPIVISVPLCYYDDTDSAKASRRQLKGAMYSVLFSMNVPAVCAINQATLALYAARRTSGIVVNIGFQVTSVVPILHGKIMRKVGVEVIGMGALKLTGYLRELMHQNNIRFQSLYTVRTLKENLCYVAEDYEAELSKDTHASFEVAGEGLFTLSKERFRTGEILFQPRLAGVLAMGLHHAVALCMDHCHAAELVDDDSWFKTVVLSGGTACLPGLAGRLEKELHEFLPAPVSEGIIVIPPPFGADTPWYGAKLVSNLSTFPGSWCKTKKHFQNKSKFKIS